MVKLPPNDTWRCEKSFGAMVVTGRSIVAGRWATDGPGEPDPGDEVVMLGPLRRPVAAEFAGRHHEVRQGGSLPKGSCGMVRFACSRTPLGMGRATLPRSRIGAGCKRAVVETMARLLREEGRD